MCYQGSVSVSGSLFSPKKMKTGQLFFLEGGKAAFASVAPECRNTLAAQGEP